MKGLESADVRQEAWNFCLVWANVAIVLIELQLKVLEVFQA